MSGRDGASLDRAGRDSEHGVKHSLHSLLRVASLSGTVSGVLMAIVIASASRLRTGDAARGLNAISHMCWGPEAGRQSPWSLRHTGTGVVLNQLACLFWAVCYESLLRTRRPPLAERRCIHAMNISLLAYVVDYHVVPRRFTPGFERVFSRAWFPFLYVGLAASLWAGVRFRLRFASDRPGS